MDTEHPQSAMTPWQDCLVDTILEELALGTRVRITLPGRPEPMLIEDCRVERALVLLSDPEGTRYYLGSMDGVLLTAEEKRGRGTGTWRPHAWTPTMSLDGSRPDIRSIRHAPDAFDV